MLPIGMPEWRQIVVHRNYIVIYKVGVLDIKNLSVNNIHLHVDLPEGHDSSSQVIQSREASIKFLVAYQ
jgi:hypothetical protein